MNYHSINKSYSEFKDILNQNLIGINEREYVLNDTILEDLHSKIYQYNELLHFYGDTDISGKFKAEMFRNIFETLKLSMKTRLNTSMHILRSILETYAKMHFSRLNDSVNRKFSENLDMFIKSTKQGNKKNKAIIIGLKDELKEVYYELCDYVHTGDNIEINPFQVMEEVFDSRFSAKNFEYISEKLCEVIKYFIKIDLLAYSNYYFDQMSSLRLSELKELYLNDSEKEYFFNVTENT